MLALPLRKKIKEITKTRPLIIGTLVGAGSFASQLTLAQRANVDVIEVRLDTFKEIYDETPVAVAFAEKLLRQIRKKTKKFILLTIRSYHECGRKAPRKFWLNDGQRAEILRHLFSYVDLVDLEIRRKIYAKEVSRMAREAKVGLIHSYHEFHSQGNWAALKKLSLYSKRLGGDFFKIAVRTKSEAELNRLMKRGKALSFPNKILIGMGQAGINSRIGGFSFGSKATYGHLGQSAAPGQMAVKNLSEAIHEIYPRA